MSVATIDYAIAESEVEDHVRDAVDATAWPTAGPTCADRSRGTSHGTGRTGLRPEVVSWPGEGPDRSHTSVRCRQAHPADKRAQDLVHVVLSG